MVHILAGLDFKTVKLVLHRRTCTHTPEQTLTWLSDFGDVRLGCLSE